MERELAEAIEAKWRLENIMFHLSPAQLIQHEELITEVNNTIKKAIEDYDYYSNR